VLRARSSSCGRACGWAGCRSPRHASVDVRPGRPGDNPYDTILEGQRATQPRTVGRLAEINDAATMDAVTGALFGFNHPFAVRDPGFAYLAFSKACHPGGRVISVMPALTENP